MSLPKFFITTTVVLFSLIALIGWVKKGKNKVKDNLIVETCMARQIEFTEEDLAFKPKRMKDDKRETPFEEVPIVLEKSLPYADRIDALFDVAAKKLPIVETVSYSSKVPWLKGRPAWVADYAAHYHTSRHFIARSLNSSKDYYTQNVVNGDRFNVFKSDKNFRFHLVVDLSRCKMWFYYLDLDTQERVLLKTYSVGLGRLDAKKGSGSLTPLGKFTLGDNITIYRPGSMGYFNNQKTEMIKVFGTRWIPFDKEIDHCSAPAKGLGLHGSPWKFDSMANQWVEDDSGLGKYESDGCLRLVQQDIEELFSIIVTKPTIIELVKDFYDAKLPGNEREY